MKASCIFSQAIGFCNSNAMDLKKDLNRLVPKLLWARPKSELGEHLVTQASKNAMKN